MSKLNELVEWHNKVVEGGYFPPSNLIMDKARSLLAEEAAQKPTIDGNTSDGYHTFNELYDHRIALYLDIVAQNSEWFWKSKKHEDGSEFPGWFILGGNMGTGDISYHLPLDKWDMAKCKEIPLGKKWDGHTAKDVVERILRHSQAPNTSRPTAPASLVEEVDGVNFFLRERIQVWQETARDDEYSQGRLHAFEETKKQMPDLSRYTPTESIAEEPKSRSVIRYSAKVKGEERVVTGYFFKTPLTSENWEADHFGNGVVRFCIATEDGVAYEIDEETLTHEVTEPEEWLCPDCGKKSGVYSEEEAAKLARSSAPIAEEPLAMDKRTALAIVEYETTRARAVLDGMESENRARERQGNAHAWPESCFCEVTEELEQKTKAARQYLESLSDREAK